MAHAFRLHTDWLVQPGLTTILGIIVIALGAQTSAAVKRITPEDLAAFETFHPGKSQFAYGNVGVASGVMMLLSTLVLCVESVRHRPQNLHDADGILL